MDSESLGPSYPIDKMIKEPALPLPVDTEQHVHKRQRNWRVRFALGALIGTPRNPSYLVKAQNGAVASENKICSELGVKVLREGGNAVDATVATTFCIGVVNMFSSGIGGGGFMTVRVPRGGVSEVYTIDFRETGPALSNETMYIGRPETSRFGGLSVGVPGELRGLEEAHRRWGSLPWKYLVQPSVDLAKGWKVDTELAKRITWYPFMLENSDWSDVFAPEGRFLKEGEVIRRVNLSRTLATIAEDGPDAFYKGPIAGSILEKIQQTGGIMTQSDLDHYKVKVRPALQGTFRGRRVYTSHAPTSGPVLLHMFNLIDRYSMEERNGLNVHRIVEIMKFGFAARTKICDPEFTNSSKRIDEIATYEYAERIFGNITDETTHPPEYYKPEFDIKIDHGTSHTSVVDKSGMAVSLTSTVNYIFGSQVLDPVTGVILNNEMDDFSTPGVPNGFGLFPSPYNYPQAGKRPLSSTVPTIIEHEDGSFYAAVGGSGGSQIFPAVYQTLLNLDWSLDASQAVEYGRLHDQLYPLVTSADDVYPAHIIEDLRERGHNVTVLDVNRVAAVVQLVVQQNGTIYAASDSRKNGVAAGY
ncbi:gamma-glutamyltranspeptidase [Coprinellus micaceus]|uniref:Glutathione hydrolase n=1 Tax=Coprinellus micaceus TaxID=71717 RepID=A0A4Y7RB53_COPMI|nr:gamma-glutamyltranspeptidase [Coprinellus micaceus]